MKNNVPENAGSETKLDSMDVAENDLQEHANADQTSEVQDQDDTHTAQLQRELKETQKRALMAVADLENYRKRSSKQLQEQIKFASMSLIGELLEIVDNLNRAVEAATDGESDAGLVSGVKMVVDQLHELLQNHHCRLIASVGQAFDPNLHQAVQMQSSKEYPANTIILELRKGYLLHDRVLRPAQVFVSTGPPENEP